MSQAIIDCPPTPPIATNCPTPPINPSMRIRDFIKKQLMATDNVAISDNEIDGDENQREAAGSPPPNCSICLGQINSKCFTDSCLHTFCFSCLLEWSKIKAECPLCKQAFKSIIHNVKSMDKYEEYKVESYRCTNWATIANQFEQFLLATSFPAFRTRIHRQRGQEFNAIPSAERTSTSTSTGSNYSRIHQLFLNYNGMIERFAREYATDVIPLRSNGSAWRAYVYQRDLYALPLSDLSGRSRDISARFYRENPAQIHRLLGWLNREIIFLLNSTVHYISYVLQTIEEQITQHDMTSRAFRLHIQPFFTRHTSHFLHELINFARSPFDIIGYDRNVQYRPQFYDSEIESVILDSDSSIASPRLSPRSDLSNVTAEDSYLSNDSMSNNHSRSVIVFGSNGEGSSSRIFTTPASQLFQPITEPVTVDVDSDDCLFVCEQKPPHLRTPVMVELNSDDEDSDVMIIETEETNSVEPIGPSTSGGDTSQPIAGPIKSETSTHPRRNTNDSLETVDFSKIASESTNNLPLQNRRKRRLQPNDEQNASDGPGPSQFKMIIRSDPRSSYSSTITTGALLADGCGANGTNLSTMSQTNGSGPSTSVIRQPIFRNRRIKQTKYTIYEASSDSSNIESTGSSSTSDEECLNPKQKRLTKKHSRKTMKTKRKHKIFTKKLIKVKEMIRRLQEPIETESGIIKDLSTSSSSSTDSSSSDSSSDDEERESPIDSSSDSPAD